MRLTAIVSEIREIPRNSLKLQTYKVQGHPRSSILVSMEAHMSLRISHVTLAVSATVFEIQA